MTNEELQAAIDSLLSHLRSGTSYTTLANKQLEELFALQKERAKTVTEPWK